jgi:1-acyl-sn-glycerol-3-phosphate acyltransferase
VTATIGTASRVGKDLWQPRSGCDESCLPPAASTPSVPAAVQVGRLLTVAALVLAGALLLPVLPLLSARSRAIVGRHWAVGLLRALGVRLVFRGRRPARRALLVSNHVSWLDILVLLAIAPTRLLAKREVRDWPVIGWLAAAGGTVFIDRSRPKQLPRTVASVAAALREGAVVAVFPEGTTWCGSAAGRFRPAMFQAAIDAGAVVVPVRLTFRLADGEGTSAPAFLGEETLLASFRRVLRLRGLVIAASVAPAVHPDITATRRVLARVAESAVGMTPAPVERPQPTVDSSAFGPDPAVALDLAA